MPDATADCGVRLWAGVDYLELSYGDEAELAACLKALAGAMATMGGLRPVLAAAAAWAKKREATAKREGA